MKKVLLILTIILISSCGKSQNEKLLTESAWVNDLRSFSLVRFTEGGLGYDLANIADTLKYKFEDGKFLLIDKKGDQEKTLTFDVVKLDKDSFVVEIKQNEHPTKDSLTGEVQNEGLKLRYRKAQMSDLIFGAWNSNEQIYKFLAPDTAGAGFRYNSAKPDTKDYFGYTIKDNQINFTFNDKKESYLIDLDKNFHNLKLKGDGKEINLIRTKLHDEPVN